MAAGIGSAGLRVFSLSFEPCRNDSVSIPAIPWLGHPLRLSTTLPEFQNLLDFLRGLEEEIFTSPLFGIFSLNRFI
jgi:hypothetical protein